MVNSGAMYSKAPLLDVDPQRSTSSNKYKVGIALIGGLCLGFLGVMAISASSPGAAESVNLFGMPTSLRKPSPVAQMTLQNLPAGTGPWKELALAAMETSNRCDRDISMQAMSASKINAVKASLSPADKAVVAKAEAKVATTAQDYLKAGITAPWGFWDPSGFSTDIPEGQLMFYREAELKHGRVCMLATLGILVQESFHPLFGGNIDVPAAAHFYTTGSADNFWAFAYFQFIGATYLIEKATAFPILEGEAFASLNGNTNKIDFGVKTDRVPGDLGYDPLSLKPKDAQGFLEMQNKELLNGRLAMIGVIGMIAQEMVTHQKIR